jgi:nucleoside-diphosphate-sugar epimerase
MENVNVVINCAAVTDFRLRLDIIININCVGTLRLFELAQKMTHIEHFVHCSTSYVNSYRGAGFINEKIYRKA